MTRFYTTETLGPTRSKTPEGYTVCLGVPIARVGVQIYSASEIGFPGDPNRVIRVERLPDDVFRPETLASGEGKDVLLDHPKSGDLVDSANWRELTMGSVQNVRRGEANQGDLMLADLVVKAPEAIKAIDAIGSAGPIEVSAGYDADYEDLGGGRARQHNIVLNHVALLVDGRGRCGPTCAVGDSEFKPRSEPMVTASVTMDRAIPVRGRVQRMMDRAIKAFSTGDAEEIKRLHEEAGELPDELREQARTERHEIPQEHQRDTEDETHMHIHLPGRDQEMEQPVDQPAAGDPDTGHAEPDGDEPATKGDISQLMDLIKELLDSDDEDDDLNEEEANGGEVADRRIQVHDRRRKARDAFRMHHKRVKDEIGEIVETKHDPDSEGDSNVEGSAGTTGGKKGLESLSIHDSRRRTHDRATLDSASLKDTWDLVASRAEILSPGVTLTEGGRTITFDAAVPATTTDLRLCALRRRTLDAAYRTQEGREIIDAVTAGTTLNLPKAPCAAIEPIFNAASAMRAERNRRAFTPNAVTTADASKPSYGLGVTPAQLNAQNRERFKNAGRR
jgi:hypothetical protein